MRQQDGRLPFKQWGGARQGAGRKPKGEKAGVSHARRALLAARFPVHATVRLSRGLPPLRRRTAHAALRAAFAAGCDRFGFRLVHYAVLNDHLHWIVEAKDREALARGLKGLLVRIAKALNKLWSRRGRVFARGQEPRACACQAGDRRVHLGVVVRWLEGEDHGVWAGGGRETSGSIVHVAAVGGLEATWVVERHRSGGGAAWTSGCSSLASPRR
jgi:REP element-mobilizing transposase RayT